MAIQIRRVMDERDRGFTLIELLVVIIIIGILAAIAIPVFINQRKKGVDASIKSDLRNISADVATVMVDNPSSPVPFVAADFPQYKKTNSNVIEIAGSPATGWCARGTAPGSNATDPATMAFWYDSQAGGLSKVGAPPAGGACASAAGWVAVG